MWTLLDHRFDPIPKGTAQLLRSFPKNVVELSRIKMKLFYHVLATSVENGYTQAASKSCLVVDASPWPIRALSKVCHEKLRVANFCHDFIINLIDVVFSINSEGPISSLNYAFCDATTKHLIHTLVKPHGNKPLISLATLG